MIPENGVEDREKLPHHCNEGDLLEVGHGSESGRREAPGGGASAGWQPETPCSSTARTDVRPPVNSPAATHQTKVAIESGRRQPGQQL